MPTITAHTTTDDGTVRSVTYRPSAADALASAERAATLDALASNMATLTTAADAAVSAGNYDLAAFLRDAWSDANDAWWSVFRSI